MFSARGNQEWPERNSVTIERSKSELWAENGPQVIHCPAVTEKSPFVPIPTLFGFGGPMSFATMGDDIAALLNYLKIPKADFVGHSFGGALDNPRLVAQNLVISGSVVSG